MQYLKLFSLFSLLVTGITHSNPNVAREKLRIVYGNEHSPPYEILKPNQPVSGFHFDIIRHVANAMNMDIELIPRPWPRALSLIEQGRVNAITFISHTPERAEHIAFLPENVLSQSIAHIMYNPLRTSPPILNGNPEQLTQSVIGVQQGYVYGQPFDGFTELNKVSVQTTEQLASMLQLQRLDYGVITRDSYEGSKEKRQFKNLALVEKPIAVVDNYIGFYKMDAELAKKYAHHYTRFKETTTYKKLREKYGIRKLIHRQPNIH